MISAILLAAGESKRMGELKQLLPFGTSTIVENCIANLLASNIDELIVVLGHRSSEIEAKLQGLPLKTVINQSYREGMTRSIQTGLASVNPQTRAVLLALVDQPRIPSSIINRVIDAYKQSGAIIVKPRYQGKSGHPVIIDMACRAEIESLDPSVGLNQITRAHAANTLFIDLDSPAVIDDIDTPEDYKRQR